VAGTGAAGAIVLPVVDGGEGAAAQERRTYAFTIEIVEGIEGGCGPGHGPGDVFEYPAQKGEICPWLMDSMDGFLRVLEYGGTMPWMYRGTPYEKVIDPDGVTTEFVRCPDPSRTVVAKITRTRVG
ncbi:MAG: TIGR04076 family protein, partial [Longimicrobiales bacterium]